MRNIFICTNWHGLKGSKQFLQMCSQLTRFVHRKPFWVLVISTSRSMWTVLIYSSRDSRTYLRWDVTPIYGISGEFKGMIISREHSIVRYQSYLNLKTFSLSTWRYPCNFISLLPLKIFSNSLLHPREFVPLLQSSPQFTSITIIMASPNIFMKPFIAWVAQPLT